jgi:hypothetical protein
MRVLLVEDHPALREMMTDHLAQRGFAVDPVGCAADARAALDAVTYDLRPCCTDQRNGHIDPNSRRGHAMRTDFGRPSSSMRFRTRTAMATSVA